MKKLNQNQINYLLDTFFEDEFDVMKITYMSKEKAKMQEYEIGDCKSKWVQLYMNGRHITDINNDYLAKEFKKMLTIKQMLISGLWQLAIVNCHRQDIKS